MASYKLVFSYLGTDFFGSQIQPGQRTVEGELKKAFEKLYGQDVPIVMSGRTDTGVHAESQVLSYKVEKTYPVERVVAALNRYLPNDILVKDVSEVSDSFNARRSAKSREYRYLFTNEAIPLYMKPMITEIGFYPDLKSLSGIETILVGDLDFKHFRNLGSDEKSTVRTIYSFSVNKREIPIVYRDCDRFTVYEIEIKGVSFLYRMVRNLTGALFEVMGGKRSLNEFSSQLSASEKIFHYTTAPAKGLSLVRVGY